MTQPQRDPSAPFRVLLVNPSHVRERLGSYWRFATSVPPTGLAYIAAVLQGDGIEVRIYDQHALRDGNDELEARIREFQPDVVGFSVLTFVLETVEDAAQRIRATFPDVRIVLGNIHPTYFADEMLEQQIAHYVVREEGEMSMLALCQALREGREPVGIPGTTVWEDGQIVSHPAGPLIDLDTLPYPAWPLLDAYAYDPEPVGLAPLRSATAPLAIQGSRGCPFACTFCSQETVYRRVRVRPPKSIVDEMEFVHETYGTTVFGFIDAIFPMGARAGHEFCAEYIRRGMHEKTAWFTETRVDLVDRDLLQHMSEAGCKFIQYGIESGDDDVLRNMQKKATVAKARDALAWTREVGILSFGLFVVGMPGETRKQIESTIRLAKELDPDIVKFNVAVPFPGSQLWESYKERVGDQPSWKYSGWFDSNMNDADNILAGDTLPAQELMYLQRRAMFEFYMQPRVMKRYFIDGLVSMPVLFEGFYVMIRGLIESLASKLSARLRPAPAPAPALGS